MSVNTGQMFAASLTEYQKELQNEVHMYGAFESGGQAKISIHLAQLHAEGRE